MVPDEGANSTAAPGGNGEGVINDVKQRIHPIAGHRREQNPFAGWMANV